ncbi:MAG: DUF3280 domain-containing protein [Pseudomonadota bacterium]
MLLTTRRVTAYGQYLARRYILEVACLLACLISLVGSVAIAQAEPLEGEAIPVAIFPFEIDVERQMGMSYGDEAGTKVEQARLLKATEKLQSLLSETRRYQLVAMDPLAEAISKAQPIFKCNGCELDLAKEVGAKQSITGTVQKASANLLNISIFVRDVASGDVVNSMAVSVRQNTDAGWLRGVRWLVRNRLLKGS